MASWLARWAARLTTDGTREPAPTMRLADRPAPHFFVPGTQKGGTTSLYYYLKRHPRILLSEIKEYHFFDQHYDQGVAWYRERLPALAPGSGLITGDFTPLYLFHPHAPARMAALCPHARLIVLLRNPVDRAFSHYHHEVRLGRESRSFETAIAEEPALVGPELARMVADEHYFSPVVQRHSYLTRGYYAEQIERLFRHYPRDQVLVLQSERLFDHPQAALERVCAFLDLEPLPPGEFGAHNEHHYAPLDAAARGRLAELFQAPNQRLYALLGEIYEWR